MIIKRLNGTIFEAMIKGGFLNLCNHEKEINDINVFPVPDGDTGYNMRRTLENGIKNAESNVHLGIYLKNLSQGMLLGARGNSGVILSQLFKGMSKELERNSVVDAGELRDALIRAYKTAYSAVIHPVEGTLLTVAREGIENIRSQIGRNTTCDMVMSMYLAEMKKSVRHTPEILATLKEAGVLDSGAMGYIMIVDGMTRTMFGEELKPSNEIVVKDNKETTTPVQLGMNGEFTYGYCLEFLLQLLSSKRAFKEFNLQTFIQNLTKYGNSLAVVQSENIVKVHIHTFKPEKVLALARKYGEFIAFKMDNMQVQHEEHEKIEETKNKESITNEGMYINQDKMNGSHQSIAVVAVADGEGISNILLGCGCSIVLKGGQSMNVSSEDFVKAFDLLDTDRIVVLPNNENITPTAVQASKICNSKKDIVVIPTESVMEGYYALAFGFLDVEDPVECIKQMKEGAESILTVCVAKAVKDYSNSTFSCKKGDYIGFIGKKLVSANSDMTKALLDAIAQVEDLENRGSFVILKGLKIDDELQEKLETELEEKFPDIERDFLDGGQKIYDVIVGII